MTDHEERMAEARESYQSEREYKQRLERIATAVLSRAMVGRHPQEAAPIAVLAAKALIHELDKEPQ